MGKAVDVMLLECVCGDACVGNGAESTAWPVRLGSRARRKAGALFSLG